MAATIHFNNNDPTEDVPFRVQDRRRKGFFSIDNELLDRYGGQLGPYGLSVYMALARFANQESECFPSQSTIAKRTGMSRMQVSREIEKLKRLNLIAVKHQFGANGHKRSNLYILLDLLHVPERVIPCNTELQPHVPDSDTPCNSELQQNKTQNKKTQEEQDIQQQEPQHNTKNTDLDNAVVVALIDLGISEKVAEFLAGQYNPEKITEKMDYLAFLTEQQPEQVKNPCGWLRTAIIDDYGKPDGFMPQVEREHLAAEEERQEREEAAQRRAEEESRKALEAKQQAEQEQKEAEQLANLHSRYGTTKQTLGLWPPVLEEIRLQLPTNTFHAFLQGALLLSLEDGQAVVGLPHAHALDWVENRLSNQIRKLLAMHLKGRKVKVKFVHLDV